MTGRVSVAVSSWGVCAADSSQGRSTARGRPPAGGKLVAGLDAYPFRFFLRKISVSERHIALLVGSRTGAVPTWVRLQPPPHRTARTDFPYAALLSASCHGLWDLSTGSAFGRGPIANPVVSEESELVMEPCRTPPLPAEAATAPRPHEMSPHSLLDPQPHIRQAPMRVPDPEVVHPPPKRR